VRPATTEDLDGVVEVIWSVAAEGRWIGTEIPFDRGARRQALAARLDRPDSALFVVEAATPGGEATVVGDIDVVVARYGVADFGMALVEGWRGRGLGTALLATATDWARRAGAHKMALEVWPDNQAALALYRRAGFVEEGRKRRHYRRSNGEVWDSILMGRPL
jgi:RimJ/RimL family protein N-acetyltransferase